MRVAYVDGTGAISGAQVSLLTLISHLDWARYEPVIVLPEDGSLARRCRELGIPIHIMEVPPLVFSKLGGQLVQDWKMARRFGRDFAAWIQANAIGIVHVNTYRIGIPCSIGARRAGVPIIWHLRDIPISRYRRWLVGFLATQLADQVIATSRAVARSMPLLMASRTHVIYNSVDLAPFLVADGGLVRRDLRIGKEDLLIGNFGQLAPWKGQSLLLDAFATIADQMPQTRLLLVAYPMRAVWDLGVDADAYRMVLEEQIRNKGLQDKVIWRGFHDSIAPTIAALDILVHAAQRPEPFGRVAIEAMAAGVPVIAPNWGGLPEILDGGRCGLLFPPGDAEALARAALSLLDDKVRRADLAHRGQQWVQTHFAAPQDATKTQALYDQLASPTMRGHS